MTPMIERATIKVPVIINRSATKYIHIKYIQYRMSI
jgi:hypothetical protein